MEMNDSHKRAYAALSLLCKLPTVKQHCGTYTRYNVDAVFRHAKKSVDTAILPAIEYLMYIPLESGRGGGYSSYDHEKPRENEIAAAVNFVAFSGDLRGIAALERIASSQRLITISTSPADDWEAVPNSREREHAERAIRILQAVNKYGHIQCKNCQGSGIVVCNSCGGRGIKQRCYRKRIFWVLKREAVEEKECYICMGKGRIECSGCDGTGKQVPALG